MGNDLDRARQRRAQRRATQPVGAFGPSGRKQAIIDRTMLRVDAAAERRDPAAYYAGQAPCPERITMALDLREMYGPEVDIALGGEEPMVDEWESADRTPTFEQMQKLAELTDFPVKFFYLPAPKPLGGMFMCSTEACERME